MSETLARLNDQYASPVPAAIRRQSREADEIARAAGIANVPDAVPDEEAPAEQPLPELQTEQTQPGTTVGETETQLPGSGERAQGEAPPTNDHAPREANRELEWQQRYNTLQGKYNSEIPELQGQIRSLERMLANIQTSQREPTQPQPQARAQPGPVPADISAEDKEAYGEELILKSQAWAEARLRPHLTQLETRLMEIEGRSVQSQQASAQLQVENALDRAMPGWQQTNNDPEFWRWLDAPDPFSGHLRRAMLKDAHARGDAARALAFFQGFRREHTVVDPGPGTHPTQTTAPAAAERIPLESLAAPGRGSASLGTQGAPERRTWNAQQVAALYREKTEGRWAGREDDFHRLEQDVITATRDGRFRQ